MAVSVKVTLNRSAYIRVVGAISDQAAYRAGQATRRHAIANINALGRVQTGAMKNSIQVRKASTTIPESAAYSIGSTVPYAKYQEFGTRGHGPVRAKHLVFRIKGRGPLVFAKWVRGVTAGRFMYNALHSVRLGDFLP